MLPDLMPTSLLSGEGREAIAQAYSEAYAEDPEISCVVHELDLPLGLN